MSPGQAVKEALANDAAVTALVGARLFPSRLPQNAEFPACVYSVVSSVPESTFTTPSDECARQSRVQIDCYAKTYEAAHAVAAAVEARLTRLVDDTLKVEAADSRDLYENDTLLHRVSMDFWAWS